VYCLDTELDPDYFSIHNLGVINIRCGKTWLMALNVPLDSGWHRGKLPATTNGHVMNMNLPGLLSRKTVLLASILALGSTLCVPSISSASGSTKLFYSPGEIVISEGQVWVANVGTNPSAYGSATEGYFSLTELNASNGSFVRFVNADADGISSPDGITVSGGHLWVANGLGGSVTELNATDGSLVRVVSSSADKMSGPAGIAVSEGHVWVGNTTADNGSVRGSSLTELNASNGSLVRIVNSSADKFSYPDSIAVSGGHVWVVNATADNGNASGSSLTELNASNGSLVKVIRSSAGRLEAGTIAASGDHVWVAGSGVVTELNASSGSILRVINASADQISSASNIAVSGGHVWVACSASVTELNASNGSLVRIVNAPADKFSSASDIAVSGGDVWVTNIEGNSVTELNASNGSLVRVIE